MSSTQKEIRFIVLVSFFLAILSVAPHYSSVEAAVSMSTPFGGKVTLKESCTCSPGDYLLTVTGPKGSSGTYLYSPLAGTKTYSKGKVKQGSYLLGKYSSGGECLMIAPDPVDPCEPILASKGTIKFIGTSF